MKRPRPPAPGSGMPGFPRLKRPPSLSEFQKIVLDHYRDHGRDLAWRHTTDPYRILVSEVMLQQTQVERVNVKYPVFMNAFTDFPSLAKAPLPDVLAVWQGMGYNRRAISLQKCARQVVEEFDGTLPQDPEILATFPGIGRATAASICAFAFNMPVVFIETNIRRVFIHFFFGDDEIVRDADILPLVEGVMYRKNPRIWYWALMDLGSALKNQIPNPNRRSIQYVRQSAFTGSDREIRGMIIRMLLEGPAQDREELIRKTGGERDRVLRIISALEKEGFVTTTDTGIAIRSR
ncbi:MAG: A/G-specific adenine glycosylase [Methanoregula sp.]|nr:A/G-specific adenine glycosylase [Methanoregula sp.]